MMNPPHILYLVTRSEPGGAQSHILELLKGLQGNYRLSLASGEQGFLLIAAKKLGVSCYHIPDLRRSVSPGRDLRAYGEIRKLILKLNPDLIHAHSSKAGILGRLAALRCRVPAVFTAHGWAFADGTSSGRKMIALLPELLMSLSSKRIITVSGADYNLALKYHVGRSSRLALIYNGISDHVSKKDYSLREDPPKITMVARFAQPKAFDLLILAMKEVKEDYQLLLVGDGPDRERCQALARDLDINNKIAFLGSRTDVPEILAGSDIFVLSSRWEGLPISILEAMRAGLPVVASNVGGVAEMVEQDQTGYLVERNSVNTLAAAIRKLLASPEKRKEFGKKGRTRYENTFTADRMLERTRTLYKSLELPSAQGD